MSSVRTPESIAPAYHAASPHGRWPLAPWELLMWLDDRPGYPMIFFMEATFAGEIDRAAFERALAKAQMRHPLLASRVELRGGRWRWAPASRDSRDRATIAQWLPPDALTSDGVFPAHVRGPIRLGRDAGVRVHGHVRDGQTRLLFVFHHAATDGIGGLNFIADVLGYYHGLLSDELPTALKRPLDAAQLENRAAIMPPEQAGPISAAPAKSKLGAALHWLRDTWAFIGYRPAPIARPAREPTGLHAGSSGDGQPPPYCVRMLSAETTEALRAFAVRHQANLNDVLLSELFLAIDAWNAAAGQAVSRQRLRIAMPVNLRTAEQRLMPAANVMSYGFLHRQPQERSDPPELLKGIAWETDLIQRQRLGNLFLAGLAGATRFPRLFRWLLGRSGTFATAVLSNLGDPTRRMIVKLPRSDGKICAGNLVLERIVAAPPVRVGTALSMAAASYNDRLGIMAVGCPQTLGPAALEALMDQYAARLRAAAGGSCDAS